MFSRIAELHKQGGMREVFRGIRDFLGLNGIYARLANKRTLQIGDVNVSFVIEDPEDLKRSIGHGESDVIKDFIHEIEAENTIWDIGANVGTYSLFAGELGASVVAFEPDPDALGRLFQNINLNSSDISVCGFALGEKDGEATLIKSGKSGHSKISNSDKGKKLHIGLRRGDELDMKSPDIIKIDVEGAEYRVLQGLEGILPEVDILYIEIHEEVSNDKLIQFMHKHGFTPSHRFEGGFVRDLELIKFERTA